MGDVYWQWYSGKFGINPTLYGSDDVIKTHWRNFFFGLCPSSNF